MKLFTNKKLIQKITIVMVFLILFNFIVPNYSRAFLGLENVGEAMLDGVNFLFLFVGDKVVTLLQQTFIGTNPIDDDADSEEDKYEIAMSPGKIFSGVIYALDINFISKRDISKDNTTETTTETTTKDMSNEKWYKKYKDSITTLGKKQNNYNKGNDDKKCAWNFINSSIGNEPDAQTIDDILKLMDKYDEDKLYNAIKEKNNSYLEYYKTSIDITEEKVDEEAKKLLDDIKFEKVIKEYTKYKSKNDPGFMDAAKPENSPAYKLHDVIATWYKIMRNIALVFLLSILVYVGIRIMIASTASDSSKYKKMLMDWVVAICILFVLHYIMAFAINFTDLITSAFAGKDVSATTGDVLMNEIRVKAGEYGSDGIAYVILYLVLIAYTVIFLWYYVKRVVYIAFLTMIAPLVALTYPLDKMGDSKAQAFEMWLREFILNTIIQPVHLIIYTVMVTSSIELAKVNPIYAIVVIGSMMPAEKFIKEMFGLESNKGPKGGFAAGALTMGALQSLAKRPPPKFGHDASGKDTSSSSKSEEKTKKPRMDGDTIAKYSKSFTGGENEDNNVKTTNPTTSTEDKPGFADGDFPDSRTTPPEEPDNQDTVLPAAQEGGTQYTGQGMDEIVPPSEEDIDKLLGKEPQYIGQGMDEIETSEGETEEPSEQVHQYGNEGQQQPSTEEQAQSSKDIPSVTIGPVGSTSGKDASSGKEKKKSIRGAAAWATAKKYGGKGIRKLGRKAVRGGLGLAAGAVGAGLGLATGIASGDISQAFKNTMLGATAGHTLGRNVGDGISNLAGGIADLPRNAKNAVKEISDTYKAERDERAQYNKTAQEEIEKRENKKYSKSAEAKKAIRTRYGNLLGEDLKQKEEVIERYRNAGVNDLNTIFNAYELEQGKDLQGNDIGTKLKPDQAIFVAQMASQLDDSAASRKAVENSIQNQIAQNYAAQNMSREEAMKKAKAERKAIMQYVDMAKGKKATEAREIAQNAEFQKAYDDSKDEKQAKLIADALHGSK